jgi:hypothetical protein
MDQSFMVALRNAAKWAQFLFEQLCKGSSSSLVASGSTRACIFKHVKKRENEL